MGYAKVPFGAPFLRIFGAPSGGFPGHFRGTFLVPEMAPLVIRRTAFPASQPPLLPLGSQWHRGGWDAGNAVRLMLRGVISGARNVPRK